MSSILLFLRVAFSLAVVLGLLALAARAAAKRGMGTMPGKRSTTNVEVVARQGIGKNSSVVVVRVADRALVLGTTEQSISLLLDADAGVLDLTRNDSEPQGTVAIEGPMGGRTCAWKDTLETMRERTLRRS